MKLSLFFSLNRVFCSKYYTHQALPGTVNITCVALLLFKTKFHSTMQDDICNIFWFSVI